MTWTSCFGSRSASPFWSRAKCCAKGRRPRSPAMRACSGFISESEMGKALQLTRVRAGYGPTVVLEDVDLALSERGSLAILGRNGVGKTTLLATIMGHTTFHAGSIEYQERPIMRLPVYERSRLGIGYVPQTRDVFPSLSVEENLRVAALPGRW